ncbi:MAG: M2 family metallopeptidase, partial [Vicinamibacterales bacterium]
MARSSLRRLTSLGLMSTVLAACSVLAPGGTPPTPTVAEAQAFLDNVNSTTLKLGIAGAQAGWVAQNFITDDTEALDARASQAVSDTIAKFAKEAVRFDSVTLPPAQRRQLDLLKVSLVLATPASPEDAEAVTKAVSRMRGVYGKGTWCPEPARPDACHNIDEVTRVLARSRNEAELKREWEGWQTISPPMKSDYTTFVGLSNKGARELGFADTGAMWRAKYDMPPDAFAQELERLWNQVRPLYLELHAYVRMKLRQQYGAVVPEKGPIPAHLLGNIWAQDWSNVYSLVAPARADAGYSLTDILKTKKTDALGMVKYGEGFYTSLGFAPLPDTFWK